MKPSVEAAAEVQPSIQPADAEPQADSDIDPAATLASRIRDAGTALKQKDMLAYVRMMPPEIVTLAGGPEPLASAMAAGDPDIIKSLADMTLHDPSAIVEGEDGLGAIVPFDGSMYKDQQKRGHLYDSLIAISDDRGRTWSLLSATGRARTWMRQNRPALWTRLEPMLKPKRIELAKP